MVRFKTDIMKSKLFSALIFLIISQSIMAQHDKVTDRIIEIGWTDNRTIPHLDVICNRFSGRLAGSDAYENATLWCASEFKKYGMEENDLYTKSIPEYQEHTSVVISVIVYGLANLDHLLSREGLYAVEEEKDDPETNK
jgi:hypothetical protein